MYLILICLFVLAVSRTLCHLCFHLVTSQFPGWRFGSHHPRWKTWQLRAVHSWSHPLLPPLRISYCTWPQTRWAPHRRFPKTTFIYPYNQYGFLWFGERIYESDIVYCRIFLLAVLACAVCLEQKVVWTVLNALFACAEAHSDPHVELVAKNNSMCFYWGYMRDDVLQMQLLCNSWWTLVATSRGYTANLHSDLYEEFKKS